MLILVCLIIVPFLTGCSFVRETIFSSIDNAIDPKPDTTGLSKDERRRVFEQCYIDDLDRKRTEERRREASAVNNNANAFQGISNNAIPNFPT